MAKNRSSTGAVQVSAEDYKRLYQDVFGTENGQLVLHDICNRFGMFMTAARAGEGIDPNNFIYREGQRSVPLYMLSQVDYDLTRLREERQLNKLEVRYDGSY